MSDHEINTRHKSVLRDEVTNALDLSEGEVFLDATIGSGGHSGEVAKRLGGNIQVIGIDRDEDALRRSRERLRTFGISPILVQNSFRNLDDVLDEQKIKSVDAILLDLGLSSDQFETSGRGFTFMRDEPLIMTMTKNPRPSDLTAEKVLNEFTEEAIELIIRGFGEEKYSRKIAREIGLRRKVKPFKSTMDLVDAINSAVPKSYKHGKINPATKTFQAIRIAVNEELKALEEVIPKAINRLNDKGRLAIISFHSLEDRIVKNLFKNASDSGQGVIITKKPIIASEKELNFNPRARSAKLRVFEKNEENKI